MSYPDPVSGPLSETAQKNLSHFLPSRYKLGPLDDKPQAKPHDFKSRIEASEDSLLVVNKSQKEERKEALLFSTLKLAAAVAAIGFVGSIGESFFGLVAVGHLPVIGPSIFFLAILVAMACMLCLSAYAPTSSLHVTKDNIDISYDSRKKSLNDPVKLRAVPAEGNSSEEPSFLTLAALSNGNPPMDISCSMPRYKTQWGLFLRSSQEERQYIAGQINTFLEKFTPKTESPAEEAPESEASESEA